MQYLGSKQLVLKSLKRQCMAYKGVNHQNLLTNKRKSLTVKSFLGQSTEKLTAKPCITKQHFTS